MKQEQDENEDDKKKIKLTEEQEMISHSNGRLSSVARSPRVKYSIMIRNLSIHCTEQDLRELFGSFASPIYRLTIKRSRDGRSLLHGYADCNDVDGGNRLINHFDNYKFMGRRMRLEPCDASQKKLPVQETHASPFQIHFRYESFNVDFGYNTKGEGKGEVRVTEEMIERECGTYGEIVDVAIMRHSQYLDGRRKPQIVLQKGYGFMYFLEARGAERAAAARVIMISGGRVRCELGFSHQVHPEDRLYPGAEDRMSSSSSLSSRTQSPTAVLIPASVSPPLQTPFLSTSTTNISSPPPLYPNLSTGHATAMFYPSTTSNVMAPPTPLYYPGLNTSAPAFHPYPFPPPDAFLPPVSDDPMMYQQYPGFFVPPPLYSAASMHYLPWTDYRTTQHMQYPPYPTATPADSFPFHYTSPSTPGLPAYHQDSRVGPQSLNRRESGGGEKKSESDPHHK